MNVGHKMTVANQSLEMGLLSGTTPEHREPGGSLSSDSTLHSGFSWKNALFALLYALTPEIFQRRKAGSVKRAGGTAYLDGLRGVAALIVCLHHLTVYTHKGLELCYGHPLYFATYNNRAVALPFLRNIFVGGHFSVMLFFCISGYVVPRRLITLLHEGRRDDFIEGINSAIFRRPGRLFFPVSFTTLSIAMGWHIFGYKTAFGEPQSNIFLELVNWVKDQCKFYYFFRQGLLFSIYNFTTWTIPVELRGSMFMFVWLFATHQCSTRARILLTLALTLWLEFGPPGAMYASFFAGLLTAELDILATSDHQVSLPWDGFARWWRTRRKTRMVILHFILVAGMFLGSQPSEDGHTVDEVMENCFGWSTLRHAIPSVYSEGTEAYRWFWLFWASWMVMIAVKEIGWVRSIFETSIAQYLGRHSFALYLVHAQVIGSFTVRLYYLAGLKTPAEMDTSPHFEHLYNGWHDAAWWPFPDGGIYGLEPAFLFCLFLSLIVMFYLSEIVTRLFDTPGVKLSNWMYRRVKAMR